MELHRAIDCLEYIGQGPKMPALRIEITEPVEESRVALTAPRDTGFAGYVLVDRTTYDRLGTAELPREQFGSYQTMAGPVVLRRSRITLRLAGKRLRELPGNPTLWSGEAGHVQTRPPLFGNSARCCRLIPEKGNEPGVVSRNLPLN